MPRTSASCAQEPRRLGGFVLVGGRAADLSGRRRMFAGSPGLSVAASAACAVAPTGPALVAARGVQGPAGALLSPSSLPILLTTSTGQRERTRARGVSAGLTGLGAALITAALLLLVFTIAARRAGVRQVVKQSAIDASPAARSDVARMHFAGGRLLAASGLAHTILRGSMFLQNFLMLRPAIVSQGLLAVPMGTGRCAFAGCADVAAVAAAVLTQDGHDGRTYLATGAQALSMDEVAGSAGAFAAGEVAEVTGVAARLTGRPPRTFAAFARDLVAAS